MHGTAPLTGERARQPYEGDHVVVWAQSDLVPEVCEVVPAAWVRSKGLELPCRSGLPQRSRYDPFIPLPSQGYMHSRHAWPDSIRDAESTSCRCIQSDTCRFPVPLGAGRRDDICE
jgi:hypothetical protein